ncbi:hypothetical protein [Undibacterium umbellatum]|uniref:Uncharacterized protein n=1 Tax=Undibacterium umbellatum TaxID=2762300 RepID=A0ABR6ZB70_9BURK|nr:hypothetical protein [Undibacterium umbellatum]MBC3908831.1 hypothetical protein [Undibacterium umbellatum]
MKNTFNNTFKTGLILSTALLTGALAITAAFTQGKAETSMNIASVTISAKRMTAEQKLAYDTADNLAQNVTHTVLISAKRLTAQEKMAIDMEDQVVRQQLAEKTASLKHIQG